MKSCGNTTLYRALKKKITSISNKELLKELNIVYNSAKFPNFNQPLVSGAFNFHNSPQGEQYWWNLSEEAGEWG